MNRNACHQMWEQRAWYCCGIIEVADEHQCYGDSRRCCWCSYSPPRPRLRHQRNIHLFFLTEDSFSASIKTDNWLHTGRKLETNLSNAFGSCTSTDISEPFSASAFIDTSTAFQGLRLRPRSQFNIPRNKTLGCFIFMLNVLFSICEKHTFQPWHFRFLVLN